MGIVEVHDVQITIFSHIITYGDAADAELTNRIREEIETMWNEPQAWITLEGKSYIVVFRITAELKSDLDQYEVLQNADPRNNYIRIEDFVIGNISFVDGLGCNTGYFKVENLYIGSTTAAHEYGHTLGLDHPHNLDYRGKGAPAIMYPRGTLVDPQYQYDPTKPAGVTGGTMHPMYRKVLKEDVESLNLKKWLLKNNGIVGDFSNVYHWKHG